VSRITKPDSQLTSRIIDASWLQSSHWRVDS